MILHELFLLEDAGTCSHGWLFTLLPRTDYLNELLPYVPSLLFLIPLFLVSRSALLNATVSLLQVLYSIIVNPRSIHACGSCISLGVVAPGVLEVVCRVLVAPAAAMSSASVRHLWGGN